MSADVHRRKLVIVGDGACGKTSLLFVFTKDEMPAKYVPTVFDNYVADMTIDNKRVELALFDTAGQSDYDQIRSLMYDDADVVIICYNVANPHSLHNVTSQWVPEVRRHCADVPLILCGNKKDVRHNEEVKAELLEQKQKPLCIEDGLLVAKQIGAVEFYECSAVTKAGIMDLFTSAAHHSLKKKPRTSRSTSKNCLKCNIL